MKKYLTLVLLSVSIVICAQPTITGFNPASGQAGTTVTITGTNFSASPTNNIVYFGGVKATVSAATPTSLTVAAPSGANNNLPITVTTAGLTAYSRLPFSITIPNGGGAIDINSFTDTNSFTVGLSVTGLLSCDLDGDGKNDIITANNSISTGTTFSVLRNNTVGTAVSFEPKVDFTTEPGPTGVSVGDIDGDGKLDVVIANYGDGITPGKTVSIFKNTSTIGTISFDGKINLTTGSYTTSSVVRDLDLDGKPDLAVAYNGELKIFRNTTSSGVITFGNSLVLGSGSGFQGSFDVADIDDDGKADLLTANQGGSPFITPTLSFFKNTSTAGTLSFAAPDNSTPNADLFSYRVSANDFDGDGKPDVAVLGGVTNKLSFFRNTSSGGVFSLATRIDLATGVDPIGFSVSDLNGDGKPDILSFEASQAFTRINTASAGAITFSQPFTPVQNTYFSSGTVSDLNNDGKPEVILANNNANVNSLTVLGKKISNIDSFTPAVAGFGATVTITGTNFTGATAVRFNNVPASSFVVVSATRITAVVAGANGAFGAVSITTPNGVTSLSGFTFYNGPLITSFAPTLGAVGSSITITGQQFSTTPASNIVRFGSTLAQITASTASQLTVTVPGGSICSPISVTRGNLTGYSNLPFVSTFSGSGLLNSSSFSTKNDFPANTGQNNIATGDFDGDGKSDLAIVRSSLVSIFKNTSTNGSATFGIPLDLLTGSGPSAIALADFDNDGKLDIVVANSASSTVSFYKNTTLAGTISFNSKIDFATGTNPQAIAVGDLDNDGDTDVATANFTGSNEVSVLLNITITITNPILNFASKVTLTAGSFPSAISIGDLDQDFKPEIIVGNSNASSISIFKNSCTPGLVSFIAPVNIAVGNFPISMPLGDVDSDGKLDIVVLNSNSSTVTVLRNFNGLSSYLQATFTTGKSPYKAFLSDLNGDANLDIAVANNTDNTISILQNSGAGSFSAKIDYATGTQPIDLTCVDINGDNRLDVISANNGANAFSVLFYKEAPPSVQSFSPTSAGVGATVTITGTGFTGATAVSFGGTAATSFNVVSPSTIIALVGSGASGIVSVTNFGGIGTMGGFIFIPTPSITSFTPTFVGPNFPIIITGTNFTGATNVTFGGTAAKSFTVNSATSISAVVDNGASGNVEVTTLGGKASLSGLIYNDKVTAIEPALMDQILLFPNPSAGREINITFPSSWEGKSSTIQIIDIIGRLVHTSSVICQSSVTLSLENPLDNGLYMISLRMKDTGSTLKMMVRK